MLWEVLVNNTKRAYGTPFSDDKGSEPKDVTNPAKSQEMRNLIRNLTQTQAQNQNPYAMNTQDTLNALLERSGESKDEKDEMLQETSSYNYKEVASKIQRAKTSVSAEQAVLSAKRKVLEIKRQIASGKGDPEDLQLALTHAKRMEMVARKKKHHLELEEMVTATQKRDERMEQMEDAASEMKNAMLDQEQEKVAGAEVAIFEERHDMMDEITDAMAESGADISQDMLADLNSMIAEFGEEELKELEEAMEQLENLEVIDPHMSKEDLEDLKRKHRNSENKAIVKADMDYLKDMIKHAQEKGGSIPGMGGGLRSFAAISAVPAVPTGAAVSTPAVEVAMPSIDIQI